MISKPTAVEAPRRIASALTRWSTASGRCPPWRQTADPYKLGVAEILLQKTKGPDVEPIWARVLQAYPSAERLSQARDPELWAIVSPLGLGGQRVQRLKGMAEALAAGTDQRVPGLGPYGSAIVALAEGRDPEAPPVDGNIARVICRYFGMEFERGEPRKKQEVKQAVSALLATQRHPDGQLRIVYSLVDLGATVCTPAKPDCPACPLSRSCDFASKLGS